MSARRLILPPAAALLACSLLTLLGVCALPVTPARAESSCPNEAAREREVHGLGLPDCRSYEQVSPVEKGEVEAIGYPGVVQASRSGDRVRYFSATAFNECENSDGSLFPYYVSSRASGGGWSTACVSAGRVGFSEELLETPLPGRAELAGFAADEQQLIFETEEQLLTGAVAHAPNVYEQDLQAPAGKQLTLVGLVPPAGHESCSGVECEVSPAGAVAGAGHSGELDAGAPQGAEVHYTQSAISADGSRVFFTALPSGRIYLREDGQSTVEVSPGVAVFREATPSGSFAFYSENGELYRFDTATGVSEAVAVTATCTGDLSTSTLASARATLSAASGEDRVAEGSQEVQVSVAEGALAVGQSIEGAGIPAGTTITAVDGEAGTLMLSAPATETTGRDGGDFFKAGSAVLTDFEPTSGSFQVGQELAGTGIPPATTITAIGSGTVTLSSAVTNAGSGVAVRALSPGSRQITGLSTAKGAFLVGETIAGEDIPEGAKITAVDPHTLTLSEPVTATATGVVLTGSPPGVLGVLGASSDGSVVYFAAAGVLAENTREYEYVNANGDHQRGSETAAYGTNLYESYRSPTGAPVTTFIARLLNDGEESRGGGGNADELDWSGFRAVNSAAPKESRVTPDGQTLLFSSELSLTGYDNSGPCAPTPACREFYRYSAGAGGSVGRLSCVSCNPDPAQAPLGDAQLAGEGGSSYHRPRAEMLLPRNLSEDGSRVFFDSPDSLVAGVASNVTSVYEWEAPASQQEREKAENSCTTSSLSFHSSAEGCLFLISSGTQGAYFGDASANGDDVFFFTAQRLAASDDDEVADVYDASVDGEGCGAAGYPECHPEPKPVPQCSSERECEPPPSGPPAKPRPATSSVSGPGNLITPPPAQESPHVKTTGKPLTNAKKLTKALKACHRDKRKHKRTVCERAARKKYPVKASKTSNRDK